MYKFVCDPEALFQMAVADTHRNALKSEVGQNEPRTNTQYSDMLNQVTYTVASSK